MQNTSSDSRVTTSAVRVLRSHPWHWLIPALATTVLAGAYALLRPATWEASLALIVRNEATNGQEVPGRFVQPDEMKTVQETILELVKSRGVLSAALEQVGPPVNGRSSQPSAEYGLPSPQPSPEGRGDVERAWPTPGDIASLRDAVRLVPPKGAEFGKTEVFYLKVQDHDFQRAIALAGAVCKQLEAAMEKVRDAKAQSMIRELQKAVEVAQADLNQSTEQLGTIERRVGSDLAELRLLSEANPGEGALQRSTVEIRTELRQARATQETNQQFLALLKEAQNEPGRLVAMPNTLLDSQPGLKKLKEGLIEAQLRTAQLQGQMAEPHPLVIAGRESQAEIRSRLSEELAVAVRALEADLRLGTEKASLLEGQLSAIRTRLDALAALRAPYTNQIAQTRKYSELLDRAQQRLADARASHAAAGATSLIAPIDGPDAGAQPLGPGRATIVLAGMAGGLLAGFALVLLTVNPTARSDRQLADVAITPRQEAVAPLAKTQAVRRTNRTAVPVAVSPKPKRGAMANAAVPRSWLGTSPSAHERSGVARRKPSVEAALRTLALVGRSADLS